MRISALVCLLLLHLSSFSQQVEVSYLRENLILNPNLETFEENRFCPRYWLLPNDATGVTVYDNFHLTEKGEPRTYPFNHLFAGKQKGLVTLILSTSERWSGHIEVRLKKPLKKGYIYTVSCYVLSARWSDFAKGELDYGKYLQPKTVIKSDYFLTEIPVQFLTDRFSNLYPTVKQPFMREFPYISLQKEDKTSLQDTLNWMKVEATFLAKGGEKYLCIGQVKNANAGVLKPPIYLPNKKETVDLNNNVSTFNKDTYAIVMQGCFYAYDDFELYEIGDSTHEYVEPIVTISPPKLLEKIQVKDTIIQVIQPQITPPTPLKGIYFDFDKSSLLEQGFLTLDKIAEELIKCPTCKVVLYGYCDAKGGNAYNLNLSRKRCQTAINYLFSKGIAKEKISYEGRGEQYPSASNDTEEGRRKNRRIEYEIIN